MTFCGGVWMVFLRVTRALHCSVWVRWSRKLTFRNSALPGVRVMPRVRRESWWSSYLAFSELHFKQRKLEHFIELPQKLASFFAINIMHLILAETYFRLQKVPVLILTGKYHQGTEEDCPSIEIWYSYSSVYVFVRNKIRLTQIIQFVHYTYLSIRIIRSWLVSDQVWGYWSERNRICFLFAEFAEAELPSTDLSVCLAEIWVI